MNSGCACGEYMVCDHCVGTVPVPPWRAADMVNTPPHYAGLSPEPLDVITAWELDYCLGNVIKYIARHKRKGAPLEDLRKAQVYLSRAIQRLEDAQP